MSAPIPLQPHQLLLPVFLIIAVLVDVKWYVVVALNIINDVKHLFMFFGHLYIVLRERSI